MKSTFKDERQTEFSLFQITGMITWIFWELSLASKRNPLACPIAVSREARNIILISLTSSLILDDGLTLDPCFDDDINNDVNSLYVEIIHKNRTYYKSTICGQKLWRKQRLETHLSCVHGKR